MISATIITLNEEKNIRRILQSLNGVVEEIVIVDSGSQDKTIELAKEYGARIFFRKFDNFSNQKNFAVSKAEGNWILSADADEQIPQQLGEEIKKAVQSHKFVGFLMPRRNYILGREIKHSWWSPDAHIWLWKKNKGKWVGNVHEEVKVEGEVGELKNAKVNFQDKNISDFMQKNDFYATIAANDLFKKGVRFSLFHLFYDSILEFLIRFIYKFGFLDGWRGFTLSYLMAIYKISVWIKIYELQNLK